MKNILIIFLLSIATLLVAQTVSPKKCNTCGKPLAQCQYKGRHPKPAESEKTAKQPTQAPRSIQASTPKSGYQNGHEWVDLGLPSGTKWATMNVGASSPSDYGSYFAWGETSTKSIYSGNNLKNCISISDDGHGYMKFSKYVTDSNCGKVDGKTELDLNDDAAFKIWGSGWRIPSKAQQDELCEKCHWSWTTMGDHNGCKVVGPNGNFIFLPAAGYRGVDNDGSGILLNAGSGGSYLSSSLHTSYNSNAYYLGFYSGGQFVKYIFRYCGNSVRPVCQ